MIHIIGCMPHTVAAVLVYGKYLETTVHHPFIGDSVALRRPRRGRVVISFIRESFDIASVCIHYINLRGA